MRFALVRFAPVSVVPARLKPLMSWLARLAPLRPDRTPVGTEGVQKPSCGFGQVIASTAAFSLDFSESGIGE